MRPVPGFDGYFATESGAIISRRMNVLRPIADKDGYHRVKVPVRRSEGKLIFSGRGVHSLVCAAFHGPRPRGSFACHKDGNRTNNIPNNLYWGTPQDNSNDRTRHGRNKGAHLGECNHMAKLTARQVRDIRLYRAMGFLQREIARMFSTCRPNVSLITSNKHWR